MPQRVWILVAIFVAVGGIITAAVAADSVASRDEAQSRQSFKKRSAEIASTLQLAIQHEEDLVVSAGAYVSQNRTASETDFNAWMRSMRAFDRYPELRGIGISTIVSAAEIPEFKARIEAGLPAEALAPSGKLELLPPGKRPFYCLAVFGARRNESERPPPGYDYCSGPAGARTMKSRDAGKPIYFPLKFGSVEILSSVTPIYRSKNVPKTVAARRKAFVAWVGGAVVPKVVLDRALRGHPQTGVEFSFGGPTSDLKFNNGKAPAGAESNTIDLRNGWTVRTFGAVQSGGIFANSTALALFTSGVVLSLLLGALVFVLATGRSRALRLVAEKTAELSYLATHDALTGLPNRALVIDRANQMLARAERQSVDVAALFVDVDQFKDINDARGHAAGDTVLTTVADRMREIVRDEDTVGRIGGDEFVILLESTTVGASPEMVAERLIDSLHQPVVLADGQEISASVSIGIALARGQNADGLLRDADIALYAAKDAGRDRFVKFNKKLRSAGSTAAG